MELHLTTIGAGREHMSLHLKGLLDGAWDTKLEVSRYTIQVHGFLRNTVTNLHVVFGQSCSCSKHRHSETIMSRWRMGLDAIIHAN